MPNDDQYLNTRVRMQARMCFEYYKWDLYIACNAWINSVDPYCDWDLWLDILGREYVNEKLEGIKAN